MEPTKKEPTMETQQAKETLVYSSSHTQMECRHFDCRVNKIYIYMFKDSGLGPVST